MLKISFVLLITYKTKLREGFNENISNKATIDWQGLDKDTSKEMQKRTPSISKTGSYEKFDPATGEKMNKWVITLNGTTPQVVHNFKLVDTFRPSGARLVNGFAEVGSGRLVRVYKVVNGVRTEVTTDITVNNVAKDATGTLGSTSYTGPGFTLEMPKLENVKYEIEYYTSYSATDENTANNNATNEVLYLYNGLTDAGKTNANPIEGPKNPLSKGGKLVEGEDSLNKTIEWTITVNPSDSEQRRFILKGAVLSDIINKDQRIIDQGNDTIVVYKNSIAPENRLDTTGMITIDRKAEADYADADSFNIQLPDGPDRYVVVFRTKIMSYPSALINGVGNDDTYRNKATLTNYPTPTDKVEKDANGSVKYYENNASNKPIKTGKQAETDIKNDGNSEDRIFWDAIVNKDRHTVFNARIRDILSINQQFARDLKDTAEPKAMLEPKVYIYTATDRKFETPVSDTDKYELTKDVHYTLKMATVTEEGPDKGKEYFEVEFKEFSLGINGQTYTEKAKQVSNTYVVEYRSELRDNITGYGTAGNRISLIGETGDPIGGETQTNVIAEKWQYGNSGSATLAEVSIKKVDLDDKSVGISGAEFELQRYAKDGVTPLGAPITLVSGIDGLAHKSGIRAGRYTITEKVSPVGYQPLTQPIKVIIKYDENDRAVIDINNPSWNSRGLGGIYATGVNVDVNGALNISNARNYTNFSVTKKWVFGPNVQPGSSIPEVYLQLWRKTDANPNGEVVFTDPSNLQIQDVSKNLNSNNEVTVSWSKLPTNSNSGEKYTYFVKEVTADGTLWEHGAFDSNNIEEISENHIRVINAYTVEGPTSLTVRKQWVGDTPEVRPESITVKLQVKIAPSNDYVDYEEGGQVVTRTLTAKDGWSAKFENLQAFDGLGEPMTYRVVETSTHPFYTSDSPEITMVENGINAVTITNTYEATFVPVQKVWNDQANRDGIRPGSITVYLLANDDYALDSNNQRIAVVLNEANQWKAVFGNLPKQDSEGNPISYSVEELAVANYTVSITSPENAQDGFVITNTYAPQRTKVDVNKVWNDNNDKLEARPESITVKLFANGKDTNKTLVLDESTGWKGSFEDLYKYENGKTIIYTVEELEVVNYEGVVTGSHEEGFTITNTIHTSELPKTGMGTNPTLYLGGAMLVSGLGIILVDLLRRQNKLRKEEE